MWNAFRADFQEFVSTVTEESSNVLSKIDADMDDDEGGAKSDDDLDADSREQLASDDDNDDDDNEGAKRAATKKKNDNVVDVDPAELKEILILLRDHPGTFLEDLGDEENKEDVDEYLKDFSIDDKTDEIAKLLEEHPDTLKKNFEELCPTQVSYEDFWKRYFYRCDEDRIAKQLKEETERERKERAEAIQKGISTVTNFFGGAASALSKTLAPTTADKSGSGKSGGSHNNEVQHGQSNGLNFFGAKGRPPFVMNTAMDETEDDLDDDDDEEEELGWDDDDDDDDIDVEPRSAKEEQIEFTDKVSEDLKEQLKQAMEERDQIAQTVKMQAEEIKSLQSKQAASGGGGGDDDGTQELKLKLFETEAELAALKARVDDDDLEEENAGTAVDKLASLACQLGKLPADQLAQLKAQVFGSEENAATTNNNNDNDNDTAEKISALEQQVKQLTQDLSAKESEYAKLEDKLQTTSLELQQSQAKVSNDQANAESTSASVSDLESKLASVHSTVDRLQAENESLKQNAESSKQEASSQISTLQKELDAAKSRVKALKQQLGEANQKLKQSEDTLKQKDAELTTAKQQQQQQKQKETESPSTPAFTNTSVAETPAFSTPAMSATKTTTPPASALKLDHSDEDVEDDWGDDWD